LQIHRAVGPASAIVWLLDLSKFSNRHDYCFTRLLSTNELLRYANFSRPQRQRQFLFGRMLLRFALSRSVDLPIDRIVVAERHANAPVILNSDCRNLSFSLSHARQWVVCAIGFGCRLGVDIEAIDAARDVQSISEIVFHPEDQRWLAQQEKSDFVLEFYRLWCTREAALKLHSDSHQMGSPLIGRSEWHSYLSVKSGFTTVEVKKISLAAARDQLTCRTVARDFA
jgi:4'-phosphopantetheinyl transferase